MCTPVIAEKRLPVDYIPLTCPACGQGFEAELGETRMAPRAERVVLPNEPSLTELSQPPAKCLNDYTKGNSAEKRARAAQLLGLVEREPGLKCPKCGKFAGGQVKAVLERHAHPAVKVSAIKKKDFGIESRPVDL